MVKGDSKKKGSWYFDKTKPDNQPQSQERTYATTQLEAFATLDKNIGIFNYVAYDTFWFWTLSDHLYEYALCISIVHLHN